MRQFIHSKDIAKIIKTVIENDITESFNIAPNNIVTINDVANIVLTVADANHLEIKYDPERPNGQIRRDLDVTKFNKLIPNYDFISLENGITECFGELINKTKK